jgi:hypothetical protein
MNQAVRQSAHRALVQRNDAIRYVQAAAEFRSLEDATSDLLRHEACPVLFPVPARQGEEFNHEFQETSFSR